MGNRARGRRTGLAERESIVALIKEARKEGAGLARACEAALIDKATYYRWAENPYGDQRKGPNYAHNKLTQFEHDEVLKICCSKEFADHHPKQIVPMLADRGVYIASESTFYRILRHEKLLTHRGKSSPPRHVRPKELIATAPNQVWSWDITYLRSNVLGRFFYLYLVMDIYSRKIIHWDIAHYESSEVSRKLVQKAYQLEGVEKDQLVIHSDNGGPMKGATMLATLRRLGILPSFSRPRVSDDNAFSEALFKTLKYRPFYPRKPFASNDEAKAWMVGFTKWYNTEHLHSGIGYVTPENRHKGLDVKIMESRRQTYQNAFFENPGRWVNKTPRFWQDTPYVTLNKTKDLASEKSEYYD